jgi:hypothetical protein
MFRIHARTLLKAALLPTALLLAAGGSQAAFAGQAAATGHVTSGVHAAPSPDSYYTMQLSLSSVTVRPGYRTRITVSFQATADLYGTPVALSASGLPDGVTASTQRQPDAPLTELDSQEPVSLDLSHMATHAFLRYDGPR